MKPTLELLVKNKVDMIEQNTVDKILTACEQWLAAGKEDLVVDLPITGVVSHPKIKVSTFAYLLLE